MRSKEEANDYRYLPDPDLPPLVIGDDDLAAARAGLPELPAARLARLLAAGLAFDDADHLTAEPALADYYDRAVAAAGGLARPIAAWIVNDLTRELAGRPIADAPIDAPALAELVGAIEDGTISGKLGKEIFARMIATGDGARAIIEREGLRQITDVGAVEAAARAVLAANPAQVAQYRAGKATLLGFFVGQLLKASGGKLNPQLASTVLTRLLAE
jgi:aspartyl-tRNA(Asn)/glutamyl-tRNA(Gln) amidotransferase subunit B